MFDRLGHVTFRHRRAVLALAGVFLAVGASWGTGVFGSMISSGFDTPGSESARALARTEASVGRGGADVVVLYRDRSAGAGLVVDDPAFRDAVEQHLAGLPRDLVASATTYWTAGAEASRLVSTDGRSTYAVVQLRGDDEDARMDAYDRARAGAARRPLGARRTARWRRGDQQRHHDPGERGHRPGRADLAA